MSIGTGHQILIVEDEEHLAAGLRFNLEAEGFQVDAAETGEAALALVASSPVAYDVILLDVMLPGIDGFAVAGELRKAGHFTPLLMLTARGHPEDVLKGFEAGADDYLPKPFELAILLARLGGLLRRSSWQKTAATLKPKEPDIYEFSGKRIDFDSLELHVDGEVFKLTLMEANLMRFLIQHEGRTVSRKSMLEEVWGVREDTDTRAIDNFVVRLRKYLERPGSPKHLLTIRGVGYKFLANPGG